MKFVVMVMALCLFACGSDDAKHSGDSPGGNPDDPKTPGVSGPEIFSLFLDAKADLPACGEANQRQLVYVADESKFYACKEVEWVEVSIKGEPGTSNKIKSSIGCGGQMEGTNYYFLYTASLLTSGDLFVSAAIKSTYIQSSASAFYASTQNGATNGAVSINYDLVGGLNAGYWVVSLDRATLVVTVEYNDGDVSGSKQTWTMAPDKCVVNDYD